ncbi:hypothetical protein [Exiguobacterium sp. s133]|uniref:hypothetical protein n=1 Tax=Exiguobacterium sp. s133 TaxID=2751213 RepID=UPI001BE8B440|nr:hypothetical protein [Exiguobacterium sp. s133]
MKNEVVQHSHFLTEDTDAMYTYIEAIKTLGLKPEVELKLSQSHGHKYVFHVAALKPVVANGVYIDSGSFTLKPGADAKALASIITAYSAGSRI